MSLAEPIISRSDNLVIIVSEMLSEVLCGRERLVGTEVLRGAASFTKVVAGRAARLMNTMNYTIYPASSSMQQHSSTCAA